MPGVKTKKAIDTVQPGQTLLVLATDPGSRADFAAWTRSTGHELVSASEADGVFQYEIRKKSPAQRAAGDGAGPGRPHVKMSHEAPPLRHFIDMAKESGVRFLVCSASLDLTGLKPQT